MASFGKEHLLFFAILLTLPNNMICKSSIQVTTDKRLPIIFFLLVSFFLIAGVCFGERFAPVTFGLSVKKSTQQQALDYINQFDFSGSDKLWPNVKQRLFIKNIKKNVTHPVNIYPGEGTYFCAYSAISYLLLQDDPLGYAKFITDLYKEGKAVYKGVIYQPSDEIRKEAGMLKYKGVMDIQPADQMWFLTLAGHYKGYLNIFNRKYDPGDEDSFWASVNYAKFNRMGRKLLDYDIDATGSDFFRPRIKNLYEYIAEKLTKGKVVLYINNRIVHKKNHVKIKLAVPTHFIVVEKISRVNDVITLVYWDNGGKTLIQLSPVFLKRIVYGITGFIKQQTDAE